jgi:NitT/TauT family transport system substrate-binding protein
MKVTKKTLYWIFAVPGIALLILAGYYWWQQKQIEQPMELTTVTFTTVHFIGEAPSYIAYYNGYFEEEGLDVKLKYSPAGKVSLQSLFDGETDIITVADTPIVYAAFEREDFYIIGSIVHSDKIAGVVARKDKGINSPADLKGKKVALFQGTASDFLMDSFFVANGLEYSDVEIVNLKPLEQVDAIVKGEIDAMFCWQPHLLNALNQLGENGIRLPSEGMKTLDWLIIVMRDYAEENPAVLEKFLRAIEKGENFIADHREEAIDLHSKEIEMDREIVDALWDDVSWELYLSESMLINLENQARWAIYINRVDATEVPNYLDWIYFDALEEIKPEAITIIR